MTNTTAIVARIPDCQFCPEPTPAYADARLKVPGYGQTWGYACRSHFDSMGGTLGMGSGQELILAKGD